ncbi:hypothetical protein SAMN05421829_10719 [Aromatoleum tolulyticum]|uniref:Lipoprotein n=1 Tax=Aromatoleum tolulyticum TaxID=34027 RepID=A0A1N6VTZ2_9RHOO|nr:hypothetical protein [Aromatoleum tolulyticum]SIQ81327.1 hypothetical protein SAMN05421829_10719 [Aromatoleum tolulyticum]
MNKFVTLSVLAGLTLLASGCSTVSSVAQYKASTRNVITIKDQLGNSDKKVKLADFTSADGIDGSWCRAVGPVSIGSGRTLAQFVGDALQEELFMAGIYSSGAPVALSGHLDEAKFSSITPAAWEITLTLTSSNGYSYQTKSHYSFSTSFDAISACKNVTDAFPAAVQETLKQVVSDPRFKNML